jgi:hypothetical protein
MGGMKRFSLRNALLLTAIIALALGWWLDHGRLTVLCKTLNRELNVANQQLSVSQGGRKTYFPSAH